MRAEYKNEDQPIIRQNGDKAWYVNGKLHRDGGLPSVEWSNGTNEWYVSGELHRDGGLPAFEDVSCKWWIQICYDLSRECGKRMFESI